MTGTQFSGRLCDVPDIPSFQVTLIEGLLCAQSLIGAGCHSHWSQLPGHRIAKHRPSPLSHMFWVLFTQCKLSSCNSKIKQNKSKHILSLTLKRWGRTLLFSTLLLRIRLLFLLINSLVRTVVKMLHTRA